MRGSDLRKIGVKKTTSTTTPGFRNEHGQEVVRDTGFASETFKGQRVYHLRCVHCGHEYGANGTDVFKRFCPGHQGGAKGERLWKDGLGSFDSVVNS